jgi:hypothetical protein
MESFTGNCASRKIPVLLARTLVKIAFRRRLKTTRSLEHHLLECPDITEIETIAANPVHADVPDHEHP